MPPLSIGIIARDPFVAKAIAGQLQNGLVEGTYVLGAPSIIGANPNNNKVIQQADDAIRNNNWDLVLLEVNLATEGGAPTFEGQFFRTFGETAFSLFYGTTDKEQLQALLALPNVLGDFEKPTLDVHELIGEATEFFGNTQTVEIPIERKYVTEPRVNDSNPNVLAGDGTDEGDSISDEGDPISDEGDPISTVPEFDPNRGRGAVRQAMNAETNMGTNSPSAKNVADQQRTTTLVDGNRQEGSFESNPDHIGESHAE